MDRDERWDVPQSGEEGNGEKEEGGGSGEVDGRFVHHSPLGADEVGGFGLGGEELAFFEEQAAAW
jgi:hypothetical protein